MANLPECKLVMEYLQPLVEKAFKDTPSTPGKGRSPAPTLEIKAEDLLSWAKSAPLNWEQYKTFRLGEKEYLAHLDFLQGATDEGCIATEDVELTRAKLSLEEEINKYVSADLRAKVEALQEQLKPLQKEIRDQEKEAAKNSEVERLNKRVEELTSANSEGKIQVSIRQLQAHMVDAFRSKEVKLERSQPWGLVFTAYGLVDPSKAGDNGEATVEA